MAALCDEKLVTEPCGPDPARKCERNGTTGLVNPADRLGDLISEADSEPLVVGTTGKRKLKFRLSGRGVSRWPSLLFHDGKISEFVP